MPLNGGENSKNIIFQKSPKNACFDNVSTLVKPLKDLPDDYRQVLVLRAFEEYSYEEIAQITGTSLGTVKSRIFRAKKMLKEQYEKRERE